MATTASNTTATSLLTVAAGRLQSIAYNSVGIQTEGGVAPYTRVVNAGGASGLSLGVAQNDFKQNSSYAAPYAKAVIAWSVSENKNLDFNDEQFAAALKTAGLTPQMQAAAQSFGGTSAGIGWIHDNLDVPHMNAAVRAADRAFATPYGQAVLAQGVHVEEFAAFAMKVFNQYGSGKESARGTSSVNGFAALMDYLKDGSVVLKDNSPGRTGQTQTVQAKNPNSYDLGDLKGFADAYSQTRSIVNPAVAQGPIKALESGGLYKAILDSDSPLTGVLLRAEAKGDFSPAQIATDPDVALTRAVFG
ncbi:MAG: hypothetical protein ACK5A0_13325, partial [Polaromonas sp.]